MTLERGQRQTQRLGDLWVTFEGGAGPDFDLTDGQLLAKIQRRERLELGTRVRVGHYDDTGTWHEVWTVLEVRDNGNGRPSAA